VKNADAIARADVLTVKWAVAQIVLYQLRNFGFISLIVFR